MYVPEKNVGCPSIKAKVLSRKNYPYRCLGIVVVARESEDKDSGKHLSLNHLFALSMGAFSFEKDRKRVKEGGPPAHHRLKRDS